MRHVALLLCLYSTLACSKPPTVDFGPDKQSKVTELEAAAITKAWYEGVRAFEQVVDLDGYCMMRGVFSKYSRNGDTSVCLAHYKGCLEKGEIRLPKETYEDWQIALSESCEVTVGQLETCTNDALKQLDKALSSISCNTPSHMLDHKLQVPESCRLMEQSCIVPTLSYYIRNAGRED
jgi:hypothetical protein